MRRVGKLIASEVFVETFAMVGRGRVIEARIARNRIAGNFSWRVGDIGRIGYRIQVEAIGQGAGVGY